MALSTNRTAYSVVIIRWRTKILRELRRKETETKRIKFLLLPIDKVIDVSNVLIFPPTLIKFYLFFCCLPPRSILISFLKGNRQTINHNFHLLLPIFPLKLFRSPAKEISCCTKKARLFSFYNKNIVGWAISEETKHQLM